MNCNVHVFCKIIFSYKFGFIPETVFSYIACTKTLQLILVNALADEERKSFKTSAPVDGDDPNRGEQAEGPERRQDGGAAEGEGDDVGDGGDGDGNAGMRHDDAKPLDLASASQNSVFCVDDAAA